MKIVYQPGNAEIVVKKSRFIANVFPVSSEEEALTYLEQIRKKHYDARHNCFAYAIGEKNEYQRSSDDGEPSGTAGRPMLEVIVGEEIHDVLVVVTRYFGGTLLGTGGLVKAYSEATKEGLHATKLLEREKGKKIELQVDYNSIGKLQYIMGNRSVVELQAEYGENVVLTLLAPMEQYEAFCHDVTEFSNGKLTVEELEEVYYGKVENEVKVWTC